MMLQHATQLLSQKFRAHGLGGRALAMPLHQLHLIIYKQSTHAIRVMRD